MITLSELESGYPKKSSTVPHGLEVKVCFCTFDAAHRNTAGE